MANIRNKPGYFRLQSLGENTESDLFQRRRLHFDDHLPENFNIYGATNGIEGVVPLNR
jgi:hypothetical protein